MGTSTNASHTLAFTNYESTLQLDLEKVCQNSSIYPKWLNSISYKKYIIKQYLVKISCYIGKLYIIQLIYIEIYKEL